MCCICVNSCLFFIFQRGDEYKAHTSCISEEEKYAAAGLKVKPNKGDVKQKDWLKKVWLRDF